MKINHQKLSEIITFDGEIMPDTIGSVIDTCHRHISHNKDAKILIYFTSTGGSMTHTLTLLDFLNSVKDNVIIYAFHQISSSAFYLFYRFKGKKDIMKHTFAIIHKGTKSIDARDLDNQESFDFFMSKKIIPNIQREMDKLYKELGIDKVLLDAVKNGKDVFLQTSLLKKYLAKK